MSKLTKAQRLRVLLELDDLLRRDAAGEDVDTEIRQYGSLLDDEGEAEPVREYTVDPERVKYKRLAKENGIGGHTFYERVKRGMSYAEAATTPLMKSGHGKSRMYSKETRLLAKRNGISPKNLSARIANGWDPLKAATVPVGRRKGQKQAQ